MVHRITVTDIYIYICVCVCVCESSVLKYRAVKVCRVLTHTYLVSSCHRVSSTQRISYGKAVSYYPQHALPLKHFKDQWSLYVPPGFKHSTLLRSAHTMYLCVLCGSENKQRIFHYTTLTVWFTYNGDGVFTARYGLDIGCRG